MPRCTSVPPNVCNLSVGMDLEPPSLTLDRILPAFVTYRIADQLRGCTGRMEPTVDLIPLVDELARSTAQRDTRFPSVSAAEVPQISIEVSVLTPSVVLENWDDFILGTHGIILSKRGQRAVFLPEVAIDQGWDRDTMMAHLSVKAGLGLDGWRDGASFRYFESMKCRE